MEKFIAILIMTFMLFLSINNKLVFIFTTLLALLRLLGKMVKASSCTYLTYLYFRRYAGHVSYRGVGMFILND
jgi:hypothetical protein